MRRSRKRRLPRWDRVRGVFSNAAGLLGRRWLAISGAVAAIAAAAVIGGLLIANQGPDEPPGPKTAVIIDQLSLSVPNPRFAESAMNKLTAAGYKVDYYPGEFVTVDFYRELPTLGYDIIVWRAHAGLSREVDKDTGEVSEIESVSLFSGELYDEDKYVNEQNKGQVGWSVMTEGGPSYFGVGERFVREVMNGKFDDTIIVMMGCDGLATQQTAQAFLDKGVRAFVSWSRPVSATHTDSSTQVLLENLLQGGLSVGDAVTQTATEVGADPWFGAELRILERSG